MYKIEVKSLELPSDFIENLSHHAWAFSDHLVSKALCQELKSWADQQWQSGRFLDAKIGAKNSAQRDAKLRGDSILWLEDEPKQVLSFLNQLKNRCKIEMMLPLSHVETHLARYPVGAGYDRHLDQSPQSDARLLSFVLYLNQDWQKGDGGELRVEGQNSEIHLIEPLFGRLVIFKSGTIYHAVLPTQKPRLSLTGWMRRSTL